MALHVATARRTAWVPFSHADRGRPEIGVVKPWTKPRVLVPALLGSFLFGSRKCRRSTPGAVAIGAVRRTELLVDADVHSREQIRQGMALLQDEGRQIHATLFAAPRRVENKEWHLFMNEPNMSFEPRSDLLSEPNDSAIERAMRRFSATDDVDCVGL